MRTVARANVSVLVCMIVVLALALPTSAAEQTQDKVRITYFWGNGCPYCAREDVFLNELKSRYPIEIDSYEVWYNRANQLYMNRVAADLGIVPSGVPFTIIGDHYWIGFNDRIGQEIEAYVAALLTDTDIDVAPSEEVILPWGRSIDLSHYSLVAATAIIAFVDGINPCSLWVLMLLLGIVINSRSRKKTVIVGLTFLSTATLVYGLALVGLVNALAFAGYVRWIQIAVGLIALVWGIVNIKDFFAYRRGPSFKIPEAVKPRIYQGIRNIMSKDAVLPLVLATMTMAAGVSLAELPCTAGFPIVWSGMIVSSGVSPAMFGILLALYLLIFLLDELVVFGIAVTTLRMKRLQEDEGQKLKFIGGMVMLVLGVIMLIDPTLMQHMGYSLGILGGTVVLAYLFTRFFKRQGV